MRKIIAALICAMLLLSAGGAGARGVLGLLGVGFGATSRLLKKSVATGMAL
jgi:hypothetical protein